MEKERKILIAKSIVQTIRLAVISLMIILPVRYFMAQPFYVKGASMEPNFHNNEYLITEELSYFFGEPKRGDIIVFKYPENPRYNFIKRIIGLPGEKIGFENGRVVIFNGQNKNGAYLDEPYLPAGSRTYSPDKMIYELGGDEYFVLGDNRHYSEDSRFFGPVGKSLIIGRVSARGWPLNKVGIFGSENYGF